MILSKAAELLQLKINGRSSVTLIFIILIPKFNLIGGTTPHMWKHIVGQM